MRVRRVRRRVRRRIRRVRSRSVRSVRTRRTRRTSARRPAGDRLAGAHAIALVRRALVWENILSRRRKHASASFLHHVAVAIVGSRRAPVRRALSRYSQGDGVPRTTETAPTAVRRAAGRARGRRFSSSGRVSSPRTERERGVVRGRVGKRRRAIVATNIVNQRTRTNERRERTNEPTSRIESEGHDSPSEDCLVPRPKTSTGPRRGAPRSSAGRRDARR